MSDHGEDQQKYPPLSNLPTHVGIIMDGNGRWARGVCGLPRLAAPRRG